MAATEGLGVGSSARNTVEVSVSVLELAEVVQLAKAARDVIDHAVTGKDDLPVVQPRDLEALDAALQPLMPGPIPPPCRCDCGGEQCSGR